MIALTSLTQPELVYVDHALAVMNAALELLLDRGVCNEDDGVDLEALQDAVAEELERRADEDGGYLVQQAVMRGEVVAVVRPDGQIGYRPS